MIIVVPPRKASVNGKIRQKHPIFADMRQG